MAVTSSSRISTIAAARSLLVTAGNGAPLRSDASQHRSNDGPVTWIRRSIGVTCKDVKTSSHVVLCDRARHFRLRDRTEIDRTSFEPPYHQLARLLRDKVASGEYPAGSRLPSENKLVETYSVGRPTVRRAIALLAQEGVLAAERGRGTLVMAPRLDSAVFDLDDLRRHLTDPSTRVRVLGVRAVHATARVAEKLAIPEGSRALSIKRTLTRGNEAIFYHSEYLVWDPLRPLVEAELGVTSLSGLFSAAGSVGIKNGKLTLHASSLTESESRHLGETGGHGGLGDRASLHRLRRRARELGAIHMSLGPPGVHDVDRRLRRPCATRNRQEMR